MGTSATGFVLGVIDKDTPESAARWRIRKQLKRMNEAVKEVCEKLHLPVAKLYTARHTAATRLIQNKVDIKTTQDFLGHSSILTTERYLKSLDMEEKQSVIESAL